MSDATADELPSYVGPLRGGRYSPKTWRPPAPDAIILCLPKPLAGFGTSRQLEGIATGLERAVGSGVLCVYVGPSIENSAPLLARPFETVGQTTGVSETYREVTRAFRRTLERLSHQGRKTIGVLSMGYTSFVPEAARRAWDEISALNGLESLWIAFIDSAYPDTDEPQRSVGADGWPTGRFHGPAYASTESIDTLFLITSAYNYDVRILNERAPDGLRASAVVAPPYTDQYISELERYVMEGRSSGTCRLGQFLPPLRRASENDLVIPVVASDIWSANAVGAWMREDEYQTCIRGTGSILRALELVADELKRRIWVPIDRGCMELATSLSGPRIGIVETSAKTEHAVCVVPYHGLSQPDHCRLLGASDLAISRTGGQANATVVLSLGMIPNVVIDMPARGYMQSELSSLGMTTNYEVSNTGEVTATPRTRPLGWRGHWDWTPDRMNCLILSVLEDTRERSERVKAAREEFLELREDGEGNVFSLLTSWVSDASPVTGVQS